MHDDLLSHPVETEGRQGRDMLGQIMTAGSLVPDTGRWQQKVSHGK